MKITPTFETIEDKLLIGLSKKMSLIDNKTFELFSTFMPRKKEIENSKDSFVLDLIVYPEFYHKNFNPSTEFEKWAVVEVTSQKTIPTGMKTFNLQKGFYAVFYQENTENSSEIFEYIFREWLPQSGFYLDNRPHFDILNPSNKKEQKVYIPIKKR